MSDLKDYGQLITQIGKTATKYADQIAKNLCIVDQVFTGIGKQLAIISDRFYQIFENAVKGLDEFERISKIFSMIVLELSLIHILIPYCSKVFHGIRRFSSF